jgi:hypothetical protein
MATHHPKTKDGDVLSRESCSIAAWRCRCGMAAGGACAAAGDAAVVGFLRSQARRSP